MRQRNPKHDPRPGDVLGSDVRRRVTRVEGEVVYWVVLGPLEHEGERECELRQWRKWARNATVFEAAPDPGDHRDVKPDNITARDAAALLTLHELRDGAGWTRAARRNDLLERSGLALATWQRAIASLVALGLVVVEVVPARESRPCGYQLTPAALELVAAGLPDPRAGSGRGGSGSGSGPGRVRTSSPKNKAEQEKNNPVPDPVTRPDPTHGALEAVLAVASPGLVDRVLLALEAFLLRGAGAPTGTPTTSPTPDLCEGCGCPKVPVKKKDGTTFLGCTPCYAARQRGNRKARGEPVKPITDEEARRRGDLSTLSLEDALRRTADARKAPSEPAKRVSQVSS
jgi:DNA-binding MarR family transcriptional regulator